jgi:dsDNA-specific endonuclease/ATPase MutS2
MSDEEDPIDPFDPFPEAVEVPITDVFDLHTIQPREVKLVVEEYLNEAQRLGYRSVRIIHGKGIGVQREIVRKVLERTEFVIDWTDAPPEAGGWGATIVRLRGRRE